MNLILSWDTKLTPPRYERSARLIHFCLSGKETSGSAVYVHSWHLDLHQHWRVACHDPVWVLTCQATGLGSTNPNAQTRCLGKWESGGRQGDLLYFPGYKRHSCQLNSIFDDSTLNFVYSDQEIDIFKKTCLFLRINRKLKSTAERPSGYPMEVPGNWRFWLAGTHPSTYRWREITNRWSLCIRIHFRDDVKYFKPPLPPLISSPVPIRHDVKLRTSFSGDNTFF